MQLDSQTPDPSLQYSRHVPARFAAIIWMCLDAELYRSAVFFAERYYALEVTNHDARHLYATSLFRCGQTQSALALVNPAADARCSGCLEVKAKCCTALGLHRQAREALQESFNISANGASTSSSSRVPLPYSDEAVAHCRLGSAALNGNLPDRAKESFRAALNLNPMLWEAFEGLCAVGSFPEIEEIFPTRPVPVKQGPPEDTQGISSKIAATGPVATGTGFFTPDVVRGWMPDPNHQPFRMGVPGMPRESLASTNDSFYPGDASLINHLHPRAHAGTTLTARPLSSADESGPIQKKPRSSSRRPTEEKLKLAGGENSRPRKARPRPALMSSNIPSPPPASLRSQVSHTRLGSKESAAAAVASRRSTRLLSGTGGKQTHVVKHPPQRERRRQHAHTSSRSAESEVEDDVMAYAEAYQSPSPPSVAHSPRSEGSPVPTAWTAAQEQAAQEAYEVALADIYIYDLMRLFASAARALAMFDCDTCLEELNKIPEVHQRSPWVMAMAGRAHYEKTDYIKAERAFNAARNLEPYRIWDMEVYSTLLWHLQRPVQLAFLAQELLSIDSRSPEAWIAVGNCFSLQKERTHALTCFRRAAQVDPTCAYAYTLSGHESIDEDIEKAISFFQSALRTDPRHYNAWYGLGTCYLRQCKLRLAEYHYRRAAEIHPSSAVLLGCVGMTLERRGDEDGAYKLYDDAVRLSPDNALVRYRRAKMLISAKKYAGAAEDLEQLRESSPDEANVVFQLARVYRLMGEDTKAAHMLAVARDVSPKSVEKIKKLLETVKDEEADDEMDEG